MLRSHHAGKVSDAFAPECPAALHALWSTLSPAMCLVVCGWLWQTVCQDCGRVKSRDGARFCSRCFRLKQLPPLLAAATTPEQRMELGQEMQRCQRHQQLRFRNSISSSLAGLSSNLAVCSS